MRRRARAGSERGAALAAALVALAVSAALVAGLADVVRTEIILARERRAMVEALAAADACIAQSLTALPVGWDFEPLLLGPDGARSTPDDGTLATPTGCSGHAARAPGTPDPPRVLLAIDALAGEGRRLLEAIIGRDPAPASPALLWTTLPPFPDAVTGMMVLEGADVDPEAPDLPGLAAPTTPTELDAWVAAEGPHVAPSPRTPAPVQAPLPPLSELATRAEAARPAGAEVLVSQGTPPSPPALALVRGDLVISDARQGSGLLLVEGALDIRGSLDFTGLVVAAGGLRIAEGAALGVVGALWLGEPGAPGAPVAPLAVAGRLALRQSRAAIVTADGLLALPRRAVLRGLRDVG
ncbi:MAG: hypothetical protein E6J71_04335 [Deltaproteobacteria bacterium]|nr:MAG: hypothetical protein E6J77_09825 [Deltaproteobacteria bacterium]TMB23114.1 MAG: hypothetical protein E6J71_04335 [Deltaproteobacteria bacterium]